MASGACGELGWAGRGRWVPEPEVASGNALPESTRSKEFERRYGNRFASSMVGKVKRIR